MIIKKNVDGKDVDVDFDMDDVQEFINYASSSDVQEIYDLVKDTGSIDDICDECETRQEREETAADYLIIETMVDEMKMELIASVFEKYTLEEFEKRLK